MAILMRGPSDGPSGCAQNGQTGPEFRHILGPVWHSQTGPKHGPVWQPDWYIWCVVIFMSNQNAARTVPMPASLPAMIPSALLTRLLCMAATSGEFSDHVRRVFWNAMIEAGETYIKLHSFGNARSAAALVTNVTILARNFFFCYDKPGLE